MNYQSLLPHKRIEYQGARISKVVDIYSVASGSYREAFKPEQNMFIEFINRRGGAFKADYKFVYLPAGGYDTLLNASDIRSVFGIAL